ncbi:MAG: 1-acyl-sn-glycerol-3-phosphate acyltransferase [Leptospiraceae bacterium]|nr:1-acyl-sn-glycerol-3-phosphate acyltransferase [Leptospiraceae bacterium]MDW7976010.1 1-acyl-sn-glycerol-3-phosphate acyltransferase [Leptospiraceae bacterium]
MTTEKDIPFSEDTATIIIGGGPMGFGLAEVLQKNLSHFYLWVSDGFLYRKWKDHYSIEIEGLIFTKPRNLTLVNGYDFFHKHSLLIIFALPSRQFEETCENIFLNLNPKFHYNFVLVTKGFLNNANRRKYGVYTFHQLIQELQKKHQIDGNLAILSGPSLLYDIIHKNHIFLDVATHSKELYEILKQIFHQPFIHFSSHTDLLTAELGAILKNPISILVGMISVLPNCGSSMMGEIASRGFLEMMELAKSLGANSELLLKRSGLSDFMSAVFSPHSRNREYGRQFTEKLLKGQSKLNLLEQIQMFLMPSYFIEKEIMMSQNLAEGGLMITPILEIAKEKNIELPLYKMLYHILLRKNAPQDVLMLLSEKEIKFSQLPVLRKKKRIELVASGRMISNVLKERILKKIMYTPNMHARIKRQSSHIISSLERRKEKALKQNLMKDVKNFEQEILLWKELEQSKPEEEILKIEAIVEFYISNIVDYFIAPIRTFLIYFVMPFRLLIGKFRRGSIGPFVGGHVKEAKEVVDKYPVFYAPTHKSHLDSVELAYGLFFQGLPIPRVAAASVLMSNPIWGAFLRSLGAYVVDRENTKNILYLEVLSQYNVMMLESGIPALAYPEGTRSRNGMFQSIKTGLLSTAIDAYRESGKEVAVIPLAISHQWVPEDLLFTNQTKKVSFFTYATRRGKVYFDFGKPILVSRFAKYDNPTEEIAKIILKEWKYHFRVQEHFVISKLLYEHPGKDTEEELKKEIEKFVKTYPGTITTKNVEVLFKNGIKILKKRSIIKETSKGFEILNPYLLEYYGNMIPEFTEEDIAYIKENENNEN